MALILPMSVIALVIVIRLFFPPVPGLLKVGEERWGKRTTILLSAVSLAGAAALIVMSRR